MLIPVDKRQRPYTDRADLRVKMSVFRRLRSGFAMIAALASLGVGVGVTAAVVHRPASTVFSACIECIGVGASAGVSPASATTA